MHGALGFRRPTQRIDPDPFSQDSLDSRWMGEYAHQEPQGPHANKGCASMDDYEETATGATQPMPTTETHSWDVPAYKLNDFKTKITQANKKLAKAGMDARFEVIYTEFTKRKNIGPRDERDGTYLLPDAVVEVPWVHAELTGPLRLSHGHFTFVAKLVPEEAGITVHSAPGQELGGYAPAGDTHCGHCGLNRDRTRLYLVRDERDTSIIQLGHSCIELYTGVAPKGLWALTFDEELDKLTRDDVDGGYNATRDYGAHIDTVLAYAFAHSDKGRAYIPRGWDNEESTASQVRTSLFVDPNRLREQERAYFAAKATEAAAHLADTALLSAIKASVAEIAENSDYGRNLRVILAGESVSGKNVGILASLVKVYARQQQLEAERKANPIAKGFIGEIKERLRNLELTLTTVLERPGDYGTRTLFIGRTASGHVVKWWASGTFEFETGDTLRLEAATVKAHETYNDIDQTVITRGQLDTFEERAGWALAAIETAGSETETVERKVTADSYENGVYIPGRWEERVEVIAERWLKKKEMARFQQWRTAQTPAPSQTEPAST